MARDETARETQKSLLDRRSYLKMAAAAAATAAAVNAADSAKGAPGAATDVPARETTVPDSEYPRELIVDATDHPNVSTTYRFEVSGDIRERAARDSSAAGGVAGRIAGEAISFPFSGRVTGFRLDGPADVRVEDRA